MSNWRQKVKQDSALLYSFDIEGKSPVTVEISGHEMYEAFCPGKNKKGKLFCLKFKGATKMLGINVTNGNLIEHLHGSDIEGWIGKKITLRVAMCEGEQCIRVHAPGAKLPKQCKKFTYSDSEPRQGSARPDQSAPPPEQQEPPEPPPSEPGPDDMPPEDTGDLPL